MAVIGALGDIVFEVSSAVVRTIADAEWQGNARYATHQRHLGNALTEFTGLDPDEMSFDIELSAYLGVNPMEEMVKLWTYQREGTPVPLTIGEHAYGKYRWSIVSHEMKLKAFDPEGTVILATVSVSLQEYLRK